MRHRLDAVSCRADDGELGLGVEQAGEPGMDHVVVVGTTNRTVGRRWSWDRPGARRGASPRRGSRDPSPAVRSRRRVTTRARACGQSMAVLGRVGRRPGAVVADPRSMSRSPEWSSTSTAAPSRAPARVGDAPGRSVGGELDARISRRGRPLRIRRAADPTRHAPGRAAGRAARARAGARARGRRSRRPHAHPQQPAHLGQSGASGVTDRPERPRPARACRES